MIDRLSGVVVSLNDQKVVMMVNGIGFAVQVPTTAMVPLQEAIDLLIYFHWNQEQGPSLYGFINEHDRAVFALVLSCSGIGPKLALAVIADLGAVSFVQAVREHDIKALSKVSGIGTKKAEQMLVYLKHKIELLPVHTEIATKQDGVDWSLVGQTLESLHYSRLEVVRAITQVRTEIATHNAVPTFDQALRKTLSFLSNVS